ncbi:GroES-like protein [Sistotremastrum niveocremeum HHB9708]|uniref:GroES-like protein n=2 Tax=Sistotremastraceae TaxID=3402574 RepID=A0A164WQF9_9AGAM|nr:GroES-like protein [Sistotremastrum niveocremeum HHB9708]KZT35910.1 GroES-like protein [Sistotremastrum suecicum HHB10207 ss-3]
MSPIFKALVVTERKQKTPLTLADYEEPTLSEGDLLLENVAAAQNPVDAKQLDNDFGIPSIPWVLGGDVAGTVYKVGPGVTKFAVGDRVISFLERKTARHSGYQTYSIAAESRTVKLPEKYSFEAGSTIPLAYITAAAGIADVFGIDLPSPKNPNVPSYAGEPFLVWGGSGSVGAYAVQLAHSLGFTVISTASPANHEYVKSLGAKYVFDYRDADVVSKIRQAAGPNLSKVYDSVSENGSVQASVQSITSPTGGKVAIILGLPTPDPSTSNVKVVATGARKAQEVPAVGEASYWYLAELLNKGTFIPNKVKVIPKGLLGVNEGFDLQRQHKISGEKLVYRIADTPF